MNCPYCKNNETKVINSRIDKKDVYILKRRRKCDNCKKSFNTYETVGNEHENDIFLYRLKKT